MRITPKYLEAFAVKTIGEKPKEIALHEWEMDHDGTITLDDPEGHSLVVNLWDDWPEDEPWTIKEGTEKRWTFVRLFKDNKPVGNIGWEFPGLIPLDMLRFHFRAHLGMNK